MSIYDQLTDFGTLIYTVGDGSPHGEVSKTDVNSLSRGNVHTATVLLSKNKDAAMFIAGGNSGEKGRRSDGIPGSLREAERMVNYVQYIVRREGGSASLVERIITDCDPKFIERFAPLQPSGNTIENAENAAAVIKAGKISEVDITAEINHISRVIGTLRKQLQGNGILSTIKRITGYPVVSSFEEENDQVHIQSLENFRSWEWKAKIHHILTGAVQRREFISEWLQISIKRLLDKEVTVINDNGKLYSPDLLYQSLCAKPIDTRHEKEKIQ